MKNLTTLLLLSGLLAVTSITYAGESNGSTLMADQVCQHRIDIFKTDNIESLLNPTEGKKVTSYQVVLAIPGEKEFKEIFKYEGTADADFKRIMTGVKEHAVQGSILFVDEIKTADGEQLPEVTFYLR